MTDPGASTTDLTALVERAVVYERRNGFAPRKIRASASPGRSTSTALGAKFQPLVRACVDEVIGAMPVFTVLLQLDASGWPIGSEVWPIAPESERARDSLLSFEFPPPPKPVFWIQPGIRR